MNCWNLQTPKSNWEIYREKGQGIHHIAFAVESVQEFLDHAASKEVALIDKAPRAGAEGLKSDFFIQNRHMEF